MERPVRDALGHLHDLPRLQTHPLGELRGKALQRALFDAVEALPAPAGDDAASRVQRLMALRYAEALDSRAVAARLAISIGGRGRRPYRRRSTAWPDPAGTLCDRRGDLIRRSKEAV